MADAAEVKRLIEYYTDLLIIQYNGKPRARATIRQLAEIMMMNGVFFDVLNGFNIETAVGKQLDVLGQYTGVSRFVSGYDLDGFFSFIVYDEVDAPPVDRIGFSDYSDFETKDGKFLTYPYVISSGFLLTDEDYRTLIKLAIIRNNSNHSVGEINDGIFRLFGMLLSADSRNRMDISYFADPTIFGIIKYAGDQGLLPKPIGVRIESIIEGTEFFSFATYSETSVSDKKGFSDYDDFDTKAGKTLKYDAIYNVV